MGLINTNAIFDSKGIADLGGGIVFANTLPGEYYLSIDRILSRDDVYDLGAVLTRLTGGDQP